MHRPTRARWGVTLTVPQLVFLTLFAECGNISRASQAVPMSRRSHYNWLEVDGLHHMLDHGVEELADVLRIPAARSSIDPLRSANSRVTCLRSPSEMRASAGDNYAHPDAGPEQKRGWSMGAFVPQSAFSGAVERPHRFAESPWP